MKNLGILIIDMQSKFVKTSTFGGYDLIKNQLKLAEFAKEKNIPIFVLEYVNKGKTVKNLRKHLPQQNVFFIKKYNDNAFIKLKNPKDNSYICNLEDETINHYFPNNPQDYKNYIQESDLNNLLDKNSIKNLILTGIHKDVCVLDTAREARSRGYKLITSKEMMDEGEKNCSFSINWYIKNTTYFNSLNEVLNLINSD